MVRIKAESEADVSDGEGASPFNMNHKKPSETGGIPQPKNSRYNKRNEEWPSHSIEQPDDPQNANPKNTPGSDIVLPKIVAGRASVTSNFSDELL